MGTCDVDHDHTAEAIRIGNRAVNEGGGRSTMDAPRL